MPRIALDTLEARSAGWAAIACATSTAAAGGGHAEAMRADIARRSGRPALCPRLPPPRPALAHWPRPRPPRRALASGAARAMQPVDLGRMLDGRGDQEAADAAIGQNLGLAQLGAALADGAGRHLRPGDLHRLVGLGMGPQRDAAAQRPPSPWPPHWRRTRRDRGPGPACRSASASRADRSGSDRRRGARGSSRVAPRSATIRRRWPLRRRTAAPRPRAAGPANRHSRSCPGAARARQRRRSRPVAGEPRSGRPIAWAGVAVAARITSARRHAEADELRHRHQQVVGGAVDAQRVHVAGDRVRQEALLQHRPGDVEIERAHAVADVEPDAALARRQDLGADLPGTVRARRWGRA